MLISWLYNEASHGLCYWTIVIHRRVSRPFSFFLSLCLGFSSFFTTYFPFNAEFTRTSVWKPMSNGELLDCKRCEMSLYLAVNHCLKGPKFNHLYSYNKYITCWIKHKEIKNISGETTDTVFQQVRL